MNRTPLHVILSTMASGNVSQYVGIGDIVMIPSIVDVADLNKISRAVYRNAVLVKGYEVLVFHCTGIGDHGVTHR